MSPDSPLKPRTPMPRLALRALAAIRRSSILQIAVIAGFWLVGEAVVRLTHLPIPGGVVGMVLVLALLVSGWLRPVRVKRGASRLLADMLLFFVPAVVAVIDHREFLGATGLKVMAVILLGTVMVMVSTAITVDLAYRWRMREGGRHADC